MRQSQAGCKCLPGYLQWRLKVVNVENFIKSLKCTWIKKLTKSNQPNWMDIFFAINGHDAIKKIFDFGDMYIRDVLIPKNISFWCDIFTSWLCVMKNTECKKYNINNKYCNIPIWFNSNIKIDKKDVFFKT